MRAKTDSFIAEFPLRTSDADARELSIRLDAARQIYNAALGEALRVLDLMRESKDWASARAMPKGKERNAAFRALRERFDFKSSMADRFAIACKNACWIGTHLSSHETQKSAERAFQAVEQYALGVRGRPRFKRFGQLNSVEGKTNTCGIRLKNGVVEWSGLRLPIMVDPVDEKAWQREALARKTKYCRILRRSVRGVERWYVQLVQEGRSPLVPKTTPGAVRLKTSNVVANEESEDFTCCGGNDEHPRFHCSDCPDHPWSVDPKQCSHYFLASENSKLKKCEHCGTKLTDSILEAAVWEKNFLIQAKEST
jgi:putative transposase